MSNVFEKAVKIAQERAKWEAKVNPEGEAIVFKRLSEAQLDESQKLSEEFVAEMSKVAKKAGYKSVASAKAALDGLDYEAEYTPLRRMAELFMPVDDVTGTLARAIAPARVAVVERIKEGKFGFGFGEVIEPVADRVTVHHAKAREIESEPTRGDAARELQAKRSAVQTDAFNKLAGSLGSTIKAPKPGKGSKAKPSDSAPKDVGEAMQNLDKKLGGVRVVDGEVKKVPAVGQMKLFDEQTAPVPKVEKKAKPRIGK